MRLKRVAGAATSLAIAAALVGGGATPAVAVGVAPPSLVDDGVYPYPDAAAIQAAQHVELISGDGHILLADCATPAVDGVSVVEVHSLDQTVGSEGVGRICFRVTATSGVLNMLINDVYEIRGDGRRTGAGHQMTATVHEDTGEDATVDLVPDASNQVGVGRGEASPHADLVQLRAGTGPAPVTGSQAAVGKLASDDRTCTATLVDPRWVLTAAACFAADPLAPQLTDGAAPAGYRLVLPGHAAVGVDWLVARPGRDVTLARLITPVPDVTPVPLATTAATTGSALPGYGYGRTTTIVTDQQQSLAVTFTGTAPETLTATAASPVCSGTAGAPVVQGGAVVAVLSQGGQAGCLGVSGSDAGVVAARTDGLKTWAADVMATTSPHTWTLADMPSGGTGGQVGTVADTVFNGDAPAPLTGNSGTTWAADDTYSPAVTFNGTSGTMVSTGTVVDTTADFTLSVWARPTAAGGVLLSEDGGQAAAFKLYTDAATMSWRFAMSDTNGILTGWATASAPNNSVQLNQWTHVTIAFDAKSGLMMLDVNGTNVATYGRSARWKALNSLRLGAVRGTGRPGTVGSFFTGKLAFLQLWNTVNSAYRTSRAAGSAVYDDRAHQTKAYFNSGGTLKEVRFDGTTWQAAQSLSSTAVQGVPTAVQNPVTRNVEVYYANNGNLWQQVFNGTSWTATDFGIAASGQPAVQINPGNNNVEVYVNSGGTLKERHWNATAGWSAVTSLGAAISNSPAVVYNGFNHFTEVYFNSAGKLAEKYYSGTAWSTLIDLGTAMTGQPTAVYNPNLQNLQVYLNSGGTLTERYWNPASSWSGTAGNSLGVALTGSPTAVYNPINGNIQLYANSAGALKEKYWSNDGVWTGPGDLGAPITNSPAAGYDTGTQAIEVYLNSGGSLKLKAWTATGGWAGLVTLGTPISN
ncbi:LamG-like jellyroll fold domain-containing protein [Hamadaea tsunoensis]|uniref:LamG-like jellyroll fold domain-containing protein n=1 Tax=Hamadaea tsunoensis TaxID=53368 RepID=UPI000413401A|nr:LamG-like jellyroll fold domain-containing protein [Hamadaea tsunoensis]